MRTIRLAAPAALAAVLLAGCSIPETAADETAVQVGSGPFEGRPAKACVPAGTREVNAGGGTFDDYFYYPENQRTFDFNGGDDSDAAPIRVVSKDNQPLEIPGQLNFELNTECEVLIRFHNDIGRRYQAYMVKAEGGYVTGDGWTRMMNLYLGRAVTDTLNRVAKQYDWRDLYSNPAIKDEMNTEVNRVVAQLVNQQAPGDDEFFLNFSALLGQPVPDEALIQALKDEESGVAQARAAEAKAVADAQAKQAEAQAQVATRRAELEVARIQAELQRAAIAPWGSPENFNNNQAIQKGLNPFQPTYGSGVLVEPKQ